MRSTVRRRVSPKRIRIFYLEDREKDREKMRELCRRTPDLIYAGEASKDSADLVDSIKQSRAEVVIVDPDLNAFSIVERETPTGLHAIAKIRQQFGRVLKIMVLTGHRHFDAEASGAGADIVLHKGISTDDLRQAIRDLARHSDLTDKPDYEQSAVGSIGLDESLRSTPENPREEPMTETQVPAEGRKEIRIFHLEDVETERAGIKQMCDLTPEGDLIYADDEDANRPDLADKVAKSHADVAIVDLALERYARPHIEQVLSNPLTSGLLAVAALRKRFGAQLKIMVLTNYPEYTSRALAAGADTVKDKGISFDELRQTIRNLVAGDTPVVGIGDPVALDLFIEVDQRHLVVIGEGGQTPELSLEPLPMTFLIYLAEERKAGGTNYVKRMHQGMAPAHLNIWESIAKRVGGPSRGLEPSGILSAPARWAARVNEILKPFLAQSSRQLIIGPQKRGSRATYSLNADIGTVRIVWPNG